MVAEARAVAWCVVAACSTSWLGLCVCLEGPATVPQLRREKLSRASNVLSLEGGQILVAPTHVGHVEAAHATFSSSEPRSLRSAGGWPASTG